MSSIMMHVLPSDTHMLSLSPGPMGDISVHASVAVHEKTHDYSNHRGARYVPRNTVSIVARPSKWYILLSTHSFSMHITHVTTNASK